MSYTEEELKKQESEVKRKLFYVFVPIAIMIFVMCYYQANSLNYNKRKYLESKNIEFKGKVIRKREEGDYPRAGRFVLLDDYHEEGVSNDIYCKVAIGDFVVKKKGDDSVYFHLKNGEVVIEDYNQGLREDYLELSKKNK